METRKVQFTGNSTFTISLPRGWVKRMGIRKGDVLGILQGEDGQITITPSISSKKSERIKTITVDREPAAHVERMLIGAYVMGFDGIVVKGRERIDIAIKEKIRQFTRSVTGVEIVEETQNRVVIEDLSDPYELSQEKAARRLHLIVKAMHTDAMNALEEGDQSLASDVINRDADADRIYWLIMKEHNMMSRNPGMAEKLHMGIDESSSYFQISRVLERIGDHAVQIAREVQPLSSYSIPKELLQRLRAAHEFAIEMMDEAMSSFFKRDVAAANRTIDRRDAFKGLLKPISVSIRKIDADEAIYLALVEESVRRVAYYATDICEAAINYCMLLEEKD